MNTPPPTRRVRPPGTSSHSTRSHPRSSAASPKVRYLGFVYGTMARCPGCARQTGARSWSGDRRWVGVASRCNQPTAAPNTPATFTESLRAELMHEHSDLHITVAQIPAVNTPQFSWVLSRLPNHPQPVPPIYQSEVAARGVVFAADHPQRKQYWVGASTVGTLVAQKIAPALLDRYLARTGFQSQQTTDKAVTGRPHNLWEPVDGTDG